MLKQFVGKAGGKSKPEAYTLGYVEDFDELRTKLAELFQHPAYVVVERIR